MAERIGTCPWKTLPKKFRHDQTTFEVDPPVSTEPFGIDDSYDFDAVELEALQCASVPRPFSTSDELPIFRIKSLSPTSRSLSPIDHISVSLLNIAISPCNSDSFSPADSDQIDPFVTSDDHTSPSCDGDDDFNSPDGRNFDAFVSLEEIHAQIGTPNVRDTNANHLRLETIVEGVFLDTPPKEVSDRFCRKSLKALQLFNVDKFVKEQQQQHMKRKSLHLETSGKELDSGNGDNNDYDGFPDDEVTADHFAHLIQYTES